MATGNFSAKYISHISKFDGSNFSFWKFQLKLVLENHGLVELVEGTDLLPSAIVLLADNSNNAAVTTRDTKIKEWKQRDITARNFIVSSLDEKCQRTLMTCTTAHGMWIRLKTQYELTSQENKHLLMTKFMSYEYEQGNNIISHITAIEELATQLSDLGTPVSDGQVMTKITMTLPPSYRPFLSAWNNIEESKKTIALLTTRLQCEENMSKMAGMAIGNQSDSAFFASKQKPAKWHPSSTNLNDSQNKKKNANAKRPKCNFCTKRGFKSTHGEDVCWRKESYLEGKQDASAESALAVKSSNHQHRKQDTCDDDYAFSSSGLIPSSKYWHADSGCTKHMTDDRSMFTTFSSINPGTRTVKGIGKNNSPLAVLGIGDVRIRSQVNDDWHDGMIHGVLFVPDLGMTLFSIGEATDRGMKATFDNASVIITKGEKTVATGVRINKHLYRMNIQSLQDEALHASGFPATRSSLQLWHERLGHVSNSTIQKMCKLKVADGLNVTPSSAVQFCEGCVLGKHHRLPFPTGGRNRATKIGELVHTDVCGPMRKPSLNGALYYVAFRDDYTGYRVVNFMKRKSEVFEHLKNYSARLENETGHRIITLRGDNGGEYTSNELEAWLKEKGIRHETSVAKTPEQNGVSERTNRTILESARSMLHSSSLGVELWAEAVACAIYLLNRVLTTAMTESTPYFGWYGRKSNVSHLRVFGCTAYAHIPADERSKLDPKGLKCFFVGYAETQKGFRLYEPVSRKVKI